MDLIHGDTNRAEIGIVRDFVSYDAQIHNNCNLADNTFSLKMSIGAWRADKIMKGDCVFVPDTEWGGIVSSVKKDTGADTVTVTGCLWRAMLSMCIIKPPAGVAYKVYENIELNALIADVVGLQQNTLFDISDVDTGVTTSTQFRYNTALYGLSSSLKKVGYTLACEYNAITQKAMLSARQIIDYSGEYDISTDLGIDITTMSGRVDDYNHVIALGSGELENRTVIELWMMNGIIYETKPDSMTDESIKSMVFDYPNAESDEELTASASNALLEHAATTSAEIDVSQTTLNLLLDDFIMVIDRDLNISSGKTVAQRILKIDNGGEQIQTEVE
jgi:hypothetical protein